MTSETNLKDCLLILMFLLGLISMAAGRTIYVDDDGPADFNNIQAAIDDSHNGDTVKIMPGVYTGNGNRGIDFKGKAITVQSAEPDDPCVIVSTVIDCQGLNCGFYFHSQENSDSVVNGLTIINGYAADGGGIINIVSNPTIKNCIFKGNSVDSFSGHGGGMYNYICNPIIINCTFSNNYAHYGAGMYNGPKSHPILQNCLFIENEGVAGGGMYNVDGSNPTITNCSFINNTGCSDRDDCVGGIRNQGGSSYGGCNPVITNCILWGNSDGGGTDESAQISYYAGGTPIINYCCIQSWSGSLGGTGNFGDDPLFMYSGYHLDANSPCIDVGDPNGDYNEQVDIDGQPRVMGSRVDIGCDEYTNKPIIKIWPGEFELLASEENPDPQTKILSVRNVGHGVVNWQITEDCDWLEVLPTNGDSVGEIDHVTITVDATGLPRDDYNCELQVSDPNAINSPQIATIQLRVGPRLVPQEYPTIQSAIDAAKNGDTIIVSPDIYTGNINISRKNITVTSIDPNDPCVVAGTVIQGDGTTSVVTFSGNESPICKLAGFTITGGHASMWGGGILGNYTYATITHCVITGNTAVDGGGIDSCNGSISHCTITMNNGDCGAGLSRCHGVIIHCLVAHNGHGTSYGSGINSCGAAILNCTIVANEDKGIRGCDGNITNCIIWYNPGGISESSNPTYSCWPDGASGTGNINSDPLFINPAAGDFHLMVNSPCVNAGDPCSTPGPGETDIDGEPRIINRFIDMGADEVNYEGPLLEISPVEFEFFVYPDGLNPQPQTMYISNKGLSTLNWVIAEDCNWLQVLPSAGDSTGELDEVALSVDISTLAPQDYNCQLIVSDPNAVHSPKSARVYLYFLKEYHVPSPNYPTIQSAIDAASYRDIVVVEPNTYYENINLSGKNITVTSINPDDQDIINTTIIDSNRNGRPVTFKGTENENCKLTGFTITGGYISGAGGGGILGNYTQAQITKCNIMSNDASYGGGLAFCDGEISHCWIRFNQAVDDGGGIYRCSARISNCLITDNHAGDDGGGMYECDGDITNCTIAMNGIMLGRGAGLDRCNGNITNCIFSHNFGEDMHFSSTPTFSCWIGATGTGNINADPRVNFHDYHLQSEAGRWETRMSKGWVRDDVTSPCIDAGDPGKDWTAEMWPHGRRINMGAYGGTPEASMSLSDAGNIADLNNDDSVDYIDLMLFTDKWPYQKNLLPEDFDRNGFVDFIDFAIFSDNWCWEQ